MAVSPVTRGIKSLWKDQILTDCTVPVRDTKFRVHKVALASSSLLFRNILTSKKNPPQGCHFKVENISSDVFQHILEFIYCGEFKEETSVEKFKALLACAEFLQIPTALEACQLALRERACGENHHVQTKSPMYDIRQLWKDEILTDYTINVEDMEFKVHKVALASASIYFRTMFTSDFSEKQKSQIRLEGMKAEVIQQMIDFVYTGEFVKENFEELFICADYLQIPAAIEVCIDAIYKTLTINDCLEKYELFRSMCAVDGVHLTRIFIQSNMRDLLNVHPIEEMPIELLLVLIDKWSLPEWDLVQLIHAWINVDCKERKVHIDQLFGQVRFALLKQSELKKLKRMKLIRDKSSGGWVTQIAKAEEYRSLPTHQKVIFESDQHKVRVDPSPFCFSLSLQGQYSHSGTSWQRQKAVAPIGINSRYASVIAEVNGFLLVVKYHKFSDRRHGTFIYDMRAQEWTRLPCTIKERLRCGFAYYKGHMYAMGGFEHTSQTSASCVGPKKLHNDIEKYNFSTNSWELLATKMPLPIADPSLAVAGDCVFLANGVTSEGRLSNGFFCFDGNHKGWAVKSLPPKRSPIAAITIKGEEAIFLYHTDTSNIHYYQTTNDQWSKLNLATLNSSLTFSAQDIVEISGNILFLNRLSSTCARSLKYSKFAPKDARNKDCTSWSECVMWILWSGAEMITEIKLEPFPMVHYGQHWYQPALVPFIGK